jgi:hypothetical protein
VTQPLEKRKEMTVTFYRRNGACAAKFHDLGDPKGSATFPRDTWEAVCREVAKSLDKRML